MFSRPAARRSALTLLEVLVALMLTAFIAVAAHNVIATISDTSSRLDQAGTSEDRDANADRLLRNLVAQIETNGDSTTRVQGDSASVNFVTWCRTARDWQEHCAVQLSLYPRDSLLELTVRTTEGDSLTLRSLPLDAQFVYFGGSLGNGQWSPFWKRSVLPPAAIGIMHGSDTTVWRLGDRG